MKLEEFNQDVLGWIIGYSDAIKSIDKHRYGSIDVEITDGTKQYKVRTVEPIMDNVSGKEKIRIVLDSL